MPLMYKMPKFVHEYLGSLHTIHFLNDFQGFLGFGTVFIAYFGCKIFPETKVTI